MAALTYRLIAFDMDGTFLSDDKSISRENLAALDAAAERGAVIVPATGRVVSGIPEPLMALPYIRYFISINGARVYDRAGDRVLYRGEIPVELALRVLEYMDTLPVLYDCYQDDRGWMSRDMYQRAAEYFVSEPNMYDFFRRMRQPVDDLKETLRRRNRPVQKLQMHFRPEHEPERRRQMELVPQLFPGIIASSSLRNNVELNSVTAGKGLALQALCEELGMSTAEAVAFGDGSNDTDMLRRAGLGIAMANAAPEVKAAADRLTATNNEAGVARAIWELIEAGQLGGGTA